jgi:hypothetical protein
MRPNSIFAVALAGLAVAPVLTAPPATAVPAHTLAAPAVSWDFDGDGVRDLAGGDPGPEEGGSGRVLVRRGTAEGYGDALVLQHPDAMGRNDAFGAALASADLDLDGFADLVVGAPTYSSPAGYGSVTVFRGSADGLTPESANTVVWPPRTHDDDTAFGRSLVVAPLDDDQWPDIAVGAPDDDGDRGTDLSRVVVLRGGPAGYAAERSWAIMPPKGTRWFGEVLAAADVDRDGHVDLVESGSWSDRGSHIAFLRGTDSGPHRARVLTTGWADSIAVGGVTGDRYPDIVAGRSFGRYDPTKSKPYVGAGRVTLFRGSPDGPRAGVSVTQASPGVPGTQHYRDFFGASVAVLDVNHDGRSEVVAGVPGHDVAGVRDAGAITVLRVGRAGFRRTGNRMMTRSTPGVPGGPRKFGNFGLEVAAQDRSGDGVPDLLVASRGTAAGRRLTVLGVVTGKLGSGSSTDTVGVPGHLPRQGASA